MLKGLFLDDWRTINESQINYPENVEWTVVRTSDEFKTAIESQSFDVVSFDYDLGRKSKKNGHGCLLDFIHDCLNKKKLPEYLFVHSEEPRWGSVMKDICEDVKMEFSEFQHNN